MRWSRLWTERPPRRGRRRSSSSSRDSSCWCRSSTSCSPSRRSRRHRSPSRGPLGRRAACSCRPESIAEANAAAARAVEVTLADYGLDASDATVTIACRPNPSACLTRRGFVTVSVQVTGAAAARATRARRRRARGRPGAVRLHRAGVAVRGCPVTGRMRRRDDRGSILPLVILYGILALALVLIVTAATSLYLEKKRLFTLADGAALVGAESFSLTEVDSWSGRAAAAAASGGGARVGRRTTSAATRSARSRRCDSWRRRLSTG